MGMKRISIILLLLAFTLAPQAQTKNTKRKAPAKKTTVQRKKRGTTGKSTVTTPSVQSLQNQRQKIQQQIKEQEKKLRSNQQDVKKRLQNLMILNTEIEGKRRSIDTIRRNIDTLDVAIDRLCVQLDNLQEELNECKRRYVKSMRYLYRNRDIQSRMMFVFSAKNFSQMYRRMRFVNEYASYQQTQGEAVISMQEQVKEAFHELSAAKRQKNDLLYRGEQERKSLENKQVEQQAVVNSLKKQQKTIQSIIDKQRKRDAELNAQIDRLIAEEIARAKARAEAEAKRKAAEAEAKRKAEELARKKAAAEAARKENERRIAEARAREEKAKAAARAAARKSAQEKAEAERKAREAENARLAAERKAAAEAKAHEKEVAAVKKEVAETYTVSSVDRQLSGTFESNRGRLPMPIVGSYRIMNHFGTNTVTDVKGHVTLDKKGIDIKGQPGATVRCIFDGEVSAVMGYGGTTVVIVRHGTYLSVYCDLASVSVSRGQKVSARQTIGRVGSDGVMQFQLRKGNEKLNPERWLAR